MKVAFFGLQSSFDYYQIGGTESIIRRFAKEMVKQGDEIDCIFFNASDECIKSPLPKLKLRYVKSFEQALSLLLEGYEHVVSLYMPHWARLRYIWFRLAHRDKVKFYTIHFSMSYHFFKRGLRCLDSIIAFNKVFVISPRLQKMMQKWGVTPALVLPPVPSSYFVDINTKPKIQQIKITYIGRIEKSKGIEDVLSLFTSLKDNEKIESSIYGYHWPGDTYGVKIHNWLSSQNRIKYVDVSYGGFSPEIEEHLKRTLFETDVLLLPYRDPRGTIDLPMLLVEGLASLCTIVTRSFGDIPAIYGPSPFLINTSDNLKKVISLVQDFTKIHMERERINKLNTKRNFEASHVVSLFRSFLDSNS